MSQPPIAWPSFDGDSPQDVIEAGTQLCLKCGLCCIGAIYSKMSSSADDSYTFCDTPLEFYFSKKPKGGKPPKVSTVLPCDCHVGGRCSIFPNRPRTCSTYSCNLLDKVFNGDIDSDKAFHVVDVTKGQFEWLREFASANGFFKRGRKSLKKVIDDFFESASERATYLPLFETEVEFALKVFEYLQNIDRYFEDRSVYEFSQLIGSLKSEKEISRNKDLVKKYLTNANGNFVELVNCSEIADPLSRIIRGYIRDPDSNHTEGGRIELRIWKLAGRYHWDTPYPGPHSRPETELRALDDVLSDIHYHADRLFSPNAGAFVHLHMAGVEFPAGLVLLLGDHEAGKTNMSLALAARGHKIMGDDQISVDLETRQAVANGRIPLHRLAPGDAVQIPDNLQILEYDGSLDDERYRYIDIPDSLLAPMYGRSTIIGAVILNRSNGVDENVISRASKLDIMKRLVASMDNLEHASSRCVKSLSLICDSIAGYELQYKDAASAVPLLEKTFLER